LWLTVRSWNKRITREEKKSYTVSDICSESHYNEHRCIHLSRIDDYKDSSSCLAKSRSRASRDRAWSNSARLRIHWQTCHNILHDYSHMIYNDRCTNLHHLYHGRSLLPLAMLNYWSFPIINKKECRENSIVVGMLVDDIIYFHLLRI
jgi:hypothetical protein